MTLQVSLPGHSAPMKVDLAAAFLRMQLEELARLRQFLRPLETRASH